MERDERYNRRNDRNRQQWSREFDEELDSHLSRYQDDNYDRSDRDMNYDGRSSDRNREGLSEYRDRYSSRGNYYGMPDEGYEYRNVRSQGGTSSNYSAGPVGGYGASNYRGASDENRDQGYDYNEWSNSNRNRSGNRNDDSGSYGTGWRSSDYENRRSGDNDDHYRYGDPNPYMDNQRNRDSGGYESTRGTGWGQRSRDRSDNNDMDYSQSSFQNRERNRGVSRTGSNPGSQDTYARQDNSYRYSGEGRRVSDFSRDESNNKWYSKDNRHMDRGPQEHSRSYYNYGRDYDHYGTSDFENRSYMYNRDDRGDREDDNYATGMYSSNRAYLADHGQDRDQDIFDHRNNDYPSTSKHGDRRKSGPDWGSSSPISDYDRNNARGKTE